VAGVDSAEVLGLVGVDLAAALGLVAAVFPVTVAGLAVAVGLEAVAGVAGLALAEGAGVPPVAVPFPDVGPGPGGFWGAGFRWLGTAGGSDGAICSSARARILSAASSN
jgi:hypothetical protein